MRKPVTLIGGQFGSRHFGTSPYLEAALALTRKEAPTALYIGAANGDDERFGAALCGVLTAAGAKDVVWPKLASNGRGKEAARKALTSVDFVFVGGGDVEAGMEVLGRAKLVADLRAAASKGVIFSGMSAGAIMLGERWIRWPRADAGDEEAETYQCLGIAPCSLDTHGEGDDWRETRSFVVVRARELGRKAKAYGVTSGGALVVGATGRARAHGAVVPLFTALPGREARMERELSSKR